MRRVEIAWVDSMTEPYPWVDREEALRDAAKPGTLFTSSLGFLVTEEEGYVILAQSVAQNGDLLGHVIQIPKVAVVSIADVQTA